jgi:toxin ParE1/3/4
MNYKVFLISDAEIDILEIYNYIAEHDCVPDTDSIFEKLEETCKSLCNFPNRGHIPPELEKIGVLNYQEIHFKPYRIIYQVIDDIVYVHCVLDGRRDLQQLLYERLIR